MTVRKSAYKKQWPAHVLGQLVLFLKERYPDGISEAKLAKRLGCTQQNICAAFMKDDMKLSKAEEIVRSFGYELQLFFTKKTFICDGIKAPVHKKSYPNCKNLYGLAEYMLDSNWSIHYLAQRTDCSYEALKDAFASGDIKLSILTKVVESLNIFCLWEYTKKEETDN